MRRWLTIAIIGLFGALIAIPLDADARQRSRSRSNGVLLNTVSQPLGALFGTQTRTTRRSDVRYTTRVKRSKTARRTTSSRYASSARSKYSARAARSSRAKAAPVTQAAAPASQTVAAAVQTQPAAAPIARTAAPASAVTITGTTAAIAAANTSPGAQPPPERQPDASAPPPATPEGNRQQASSRTSRPQVAQRPTPAAAPDPAPERNQLGIAGPPTWPNAFEDVLGYAFWPSDYDRRLLDHGFGDIISTIFRPAGASSAARRSDFARGRGNSDAGAAPSFCRTPPKEPLEWPGQRIEQTTPLNNEQRAALTALRNSIAEAVKSIRAACREEAGLAPPERIRLLQSMLWAVRDAAVLVRGPMQAFYDSFTDEQRTKFIVKDPANARPPVDMAAERARLAAMARPDMTPEAMRAAAQSMNMSGMSACGDTALDWPASQIENVVRPDETQRASLESLQRNMMEMGHFLVLSCPRGTAETPIGRLDAATDRLTAMIFAASTVNLALNDFFGLLTAEQRVRIAPTSR
jgi:hypothetical protein